MFEITEIVYGVVLFAWAIIVVQLISKKMYELAKNKWEHNVGLYFARKTVHILAGGLIAILIPIFNLFNTPILPFIIATSLAIFCYIPHKTGKLFYWFQDPENMYEVHFCMVWAILILVGWFVSLQIGSISENPFLLGVVPILFMAWGDGVTGVVRNFIFKRRTKHWSGNVAMFLVCAPLGYFLGFGVSGILTALVASIIEHIDSIRNTRIDDNITVPTSSFVLLCFSIFVSTTV